MLKSFFVAIKMNVATFVANLYMICLKVYDKPTQAIIP